LTSNNQVMPQQNEAGVTADKHATTCMTDMKGLWSLALIHRNRPNGRFRGDRDDDDLS